MKLSREFWLVAAVLIGTFGALYLADTLMIHLPRAQLEGLAWLPCSLSLILYGTLAFGLYRRARRTFQPFRAHHWGPVVAWCIAWGALFVLLIFQRGTQSLDQFFLRVNIWLLLMLLSGSSILASLEKWRTATRTLWAGIATLLSLVALAVVYWISRL
jgi:hypothetical protein